MKLDAEMEMLLNEIPLLHHGGLLGCGGDEAEDLSFLIHELAAMGVVDGDDEPRAPVTAEELGLAGWACPKNSPQPFSVVSSHMPSLFDPFPFDTAADGWDLRCSSPPAPRSRCKTGRRKNAAPTASPKKCGAAVAKLHGGDGESLAGLRGFMYHVARDQHGCRFLQQRLDDGKREVDLIFAGVSRHAAQLMVDPFGNYLMQKLLAVCDAGQRMALVLALTADAMALVGISLNVHG